MITVYIGFDSRTQFVSDVCKYSILSRTNKQITIKDIGTSILPKKNWWREVNPLETTEFSICRFLVPWLNDYKGIAIFMDQDFLWQCDIYELLEFYDEQYAVMVCKHDYIPKTDKKLIDNKNVNQSKYEKKNWSSLMMFNCAHKDCKNLSLDVVNNNTGLWLHQFKWTNNIGSIPLKYNFLVDEYDSDSAKVYHYTLGGPWNKKHENCSFSNLWLNDFNFIKSQKN